MLILNEYRKVTLIFTINGRPAPIDDMNVELFFKTSNQLNAIVNIRILIWALFLYHSESPFKNPKQVINHKIDCET